MLRMLAVVVGMAAALAAHAQTAPDPKALQDLKEKQGHKQAGTPGQVVGDPALVDTAWKAGLVVDLEEWYRAHPLEKDEKGQEKPTRGDNLFTSPRVKLDVVTNRGPLIGLHYHASADEIVVIYKGEGEMYIDGKWTPVKAGQVHVNPRGVIHATRVTGKGNLYVFSLFTPPQMGGDDKIFMEGMDGAKGTN